jgi:hypothetical protein
MKIIFSMVFVRSIVTTYWAREHVVSELREERLRCKIGVVLLQKFLGGHACFQGDQLVPLGFKSADDVSHNTSLNPIGFDL